MVKKSSHATVPLTNAEVMTTGRELESTYAVNCHWIHHQLTVKGKKIVNDLLLYIVSWEALKYEQQDKEWEMKK